MIQAGASDADNTDKTEPGARYDAGMQVRREVLGSAHVDRAGTDPSGFTADFQRFITEYAWGGIWTRPGLDRRSRSMITLTALIARGHTDEFAMHVRAALRNGLTRDEIKEVILQAAIYCGVPDANSAFTVARSVLDEIGAENADKDDKADTGHTHGTADTGNTVDTGKDS